MDKKAFFITGTDTGIGKTVVSSMLVAHFYKKGYKTIYYKPVETGVKEKNEKPYANDVQFVVKNNRFLNQYELCLMNTYNFSLPASPHLAAREENRTIEISKIMDHYNSLQQEFDAIIVEGAGGILVPLNNKCLMIDLIKKMDIPAIVVMQSKLGTINHTLLTLEALRNRSIHVKGVIVNNFPDNPGLIEKDNLKAIVEYGKTEILGIIPEINIKQGTGLSEIDIKFEI